MIEVNKLELSEKNIEILSNYQTYLITVKYLNIETTIASYILDIYKYLEYTKKDYNQTDNKDIYNYLKYLSDNSYSIYSVVRKISSIKSDHSIIQIPFLVKYSSIPISCLISLNLYTSI